VVFRIIFDRVSAGSSKKQKSVLSGSRQIAVFVLLCATLTFSSVALAQQGTFVLTGSLNTARSGPTVLLKNGMVLIAGGASTTDPSAELYNPATYTFSFTGSMNVSEYTSRLAEFHQKPCGDAQ
jgi:hypothetical protein